MNIAYCIAFLLVASVPLGCSRSNQPDIAGEHPFGKNPSTPIHFIVPDRFTGSIFITEDKSNGVDAPIIDGKITVRIPPTGKIALKDWSALFTEHQETASYSNGTPVPDPNLIPSGQELSADTVYFWNLGTEKGSDHPRETLVIFVGTKSERDKL